MDKRWLIGCGGCLGVLLLIGIAITTAAIMGAQWYGENNKKVTQSIFGDTLPEGYSTFFAMDLPDKRGGAKLIMMMSLEKEVMLMAFDVPMDHGDLEKLMAGDPEKTREFVDEVLSHSKSRNAQKLHLDGTNSMETSVGKYAALRFKMEDEDTGAVSPMVLTILPQKAGRATLLMDFNIGVQVEDPAADFSVEYASMERDLKEIINTTKISGKTPGKLSWLGRDFLLLRAA